MPVVDDSYSRLVLWLKVLLPLAALAVLSTLFLASRTVDPTLKLPFAEEEVRELAESPKIGSPAYSGVTPDGAAIAIQADIAVPLQGEQSGLKAQTIQGSFKTPDGQTVQIVAANVTLNEGTDTISLNEGVSLETSTGYRIETSDLVADIQASRLWSEGPVEASGPPGRITAGQVIFARLPAEQGDGYELVFKDGVNLVYRPQQ